jgi:hypothetical protein
MKSWSPAGSLSSIFLFIKITSLPVIDAASGGRMELRGSGGTCGSDLALMPEANS